MATIASLIDNGMIHAGEELSWHRKTARETHSAKVLPTGFIELRDGSTHKTPSGAARHLNGGKPVDGWLVWKVKRLGVSIGSLR